MTMSLFRKNTLRSPAAGDAPAGANGSPGGAHGLLPEREFVRALTLERKRAERSRKLFVVMLLEVRPPHPRAERDTLLGRTLPIIRASIRETDIAGWHKQDAMLGVIFAELGTVGKESALGALRAKITAALRSTLPPEEVERVHITFHCFPDDWNSGEPGQPVGNLYPDLVERDEARRVAGGIKRGIDLLGATMALIALAPVLVAVAIAIKLTSPGPVLFRQKRIGQYGVPFTCLKFRSMHAVNDAHIHKDYVTRLIAGRIDPVPSEGNGKAVYKLTNDPRLTPVGAFLRKLSLDELPQFFNVLRGQMSLVGPRPPVPYELEVYDVWHRRRLVEVKPGITGLWQVNGRSRLRFDDMVRLDLQYATTWSVWLDIKILLRTPYAVFSGDGAH
jgi:lipopolysaccharide/colanic/teichoic acid biosynthesis glycosyltransferase